MPGVTLVIATGSAYPAAHDDAELIVDKLWALFRPQLVDWLTSRAAYRAGRKKAQAIAWA